MSVSFAQAHALMHRARRAAPDRRRYRRVELGLHGRMMVVGGTEVDCRTLDVSPGDARFAAHAAPRAGDSLIAYLQHIGRIEAKVVRRLSETVFAVVFQNSVHKREKIAEQLVMLLNPHCEVDEQRRHERTQTTGAVIVETEAGRLQCEIIDFSLTGVALRTIHPRPLIGTWVQVGGQFGKVARYFERGFAVDFQARPPQRANT